MTLFFPQQTTAKEQQNKPAPAAQQPAFRTVAQNQAKAKACHAAAMEIILPAHKNTP